MGTTHSEAEINASKFYHLLKSYNNFDQMEVLPLLQTTLDLKPEEQCFIGIYYRARSNVETILEITHAKHFQAAAMLARSIFELAVDVKMLHIVPNGWLKVMIFNDVERLRCARKVVAFKSKHPDTQVDVSTFDEFINSNAARVDALAKSTWASPTDRQHWSGMRIGERVALLGSSMHKIYEVDYPRLSWYAHSGLTGVLNLPSETFVHLCANSFWLASECYLELLNSIIRRFDLEKAITNLDAKLLAARALPFNDDPETEEWLLRSIQN